MAVHHPGRDVEPLLPRPRLQALEHERRLVGRQDLRAEARGGDAEGAAAGGHVQEAHARTEAGAAQALVAHPHLRRGDELVIARRDPVPRGPSLFLS